MNIAIIPARGGSKRIPRKNVKIFSGKPMIAWSIEAAISTGLFEMVLVSTDDEEIAEIARFYGAATPFIRPKELAGDYVGTTEVISHATQWILNEGYSLSAICCILATAPFIRRKDIKFGLELLHSANWDYVIAATNFSAPIQRSFFESSNGGVEMFFPEHYLTRSQDLTEAFHDAAQFYWGRPRAWLEKKKGFGRNSALVKIPRWRVQDIDNDDDWKRAEILASLIFSLNENEEND
jgi:pseudaminic acid cytidylyltransferase